MQILVVEPQKSPVIMETGGRLKEMQKIVGGTIQAIYPFPEEVALICNDERKILGLPLNRGLRDEHGNLYDIICGTFFPCGAPFDSESLSSLSAEQITRFQQQFHTSGIFVRVNDQVIILPKMK